MRITEEIRRNNIHFTIDLGTHQEYYINDAILPRLSELDNMVSEEEVTRCKDLIELMKHYE